MFRISLKNTSGQVRVMRQHSKKNWGGSKPSSKLTLKARWYHSCGCSDDSRSCEQMKKRVTDKYFFKKVKTLNPNHLLLQET